MYLNAYQKYIAELLCEYETLLCRQLLTAVNAKFDVSLKDLNGYTDQMCSYSEYKKIPYGDDFVLCLKSSEPNFDVIRSFEVVTSFFKSIKWHRKGREPVTIRFMMATKDHDREVFVIPVKQGEEKYICDYVSDKFNESKCEMVIFLLETKEQMKLINASCNFRFALITKLGTVFYKKEQ